MKVAGIVRFTAFCWSLAGCLEVACLQTPSHRSSRGRDHFSQAAGSPFLFAATCTTWGGLMGQSLLYKEGSVLFLLSISPINPHTQAGKRHVEACHYMNSQAGSQTFPHRVWVKNNWKTKANKKEIHKAYITNCLFFYWLIPLIFLWYVVTQFWIAHSKNGWELRLHFR